jgi:hypothetical protein
VSTLPVAVRSRNGIVMAHSLVLLVNGDVQTIQEARRMMREALASCL